MEKFNQSRNFKDQAARIILALVACMALSGCGLFKRPPPIDYFERDRSFSEESVTQGGLAIAPVTSVPDYLRESPGFETMRRGVLSRREPTSLRTQLEKRHKTIEIFEFLDFVETPLRLVVLDLFQTYSHRDYLTVGDIDLLRELSDDRARYIVFAKLNDMDIKESEWVGSGEDDNGSYDDYTASTTVSVDYKIYDLDLAALVWSGEITETKSDSYREHDYKGGVLNILAQAVSNIVFSSNPPPRSEALDESYETFAKHIFSIPEGEEKTPVSPAELEAISKAE